MAQTYKICYISDVWTSRVVARVMRDVLTSARLCRVNGLTLLVSANRDLQGVMTGIFNVMTDQNLENGNLYRLYVDQNVHRSPEQEAEIPNLIPADVVDYETIDIGTHPDKKLPGLVIETDPYGGLHLPERWARIPSTIDRMRDAPKPVPQDDPPWSPYL